MILPFYAMPMKNKNIRKKLKIMKKNNDKTGLYFYFKIIKLYKKISFQNLFGICRLDCYRIEIILMSMTPYCLKLYFIFMLNTLKINFKLKELRASY